jgi:hypothetical protein
MPTAPDSGVRPDAALAVALLAAEGVERATAIVEAMHAQVLARVTGRAAVEPGRTRGITGLVYRSTRLAARGASAALRLAHDRVRDRASEQASDRTLGAPALAAPAAWRRAEALRAVLNGVVGDHLAATGNALAIPMAIRHAGRSLVLERAALAAALPHATGRVVVLVHGLCMHDGQWDRPGSGDHGAGLARDLGYTPLRLRYNTGRHVSENGRAFAAQLEALVAAWPVPLERLAIVGHSMGGLVARSACHLATEAGQAWPAHLRTLVCLATPHHGAPLERAGNAFETLVAALPDVAPLARVGQLRSAGITDLRHGNLVDADWQGQDRFARGDDRRRIVPLPDGVACCTVAARRGAPGGSAARRLGDGLVPLASALGEHADPERTLAFAPERRWIAEGAGHFDLLHRADVYARLREWLAG